MSAEFPNPKYRTSFRKKRSVQSVIKHTNPNADEMNDELNSDWDNEINTNIWVSCDFVLCFALKKSVNKRLNLPRKIVAFLHCYKLNANLVLVFLSKITMNSIE